MKRENGKKDTYKPLRYNSNKSILANRQIYQKCILNFPVRSLSAPANTLDVTVPNRVSFVSFFTFKVVKLVGWMLS